MQRHSLDLWPDSDHSQPPRPYFFNTTPEAWPNPSVSEPETYGKDPMEVIRALTHKIETLEVQIRWLVKERDRLRQAWVFRHFELIVAIGFPVAMLLVMFVCGAMK